MNNRSISNLEKRAMFPPPILVCHKIESIIIYEVILSPSSHYSNGFRIISIQGNGDICEKHGYSSHSTKAKNMGDTSVINPHNIIPPHSILFKSL